MKINLNSRAEEMTREEIKQQIEFWETEASMAEHEFREAEEKCQEYYDMLDALEG